MSKQSTYSNRYTRKKETYKSNPCKCACGNLKTINSSWCPECTELMESDVLPDADSI